MRVLHTSDLHGKWDPAWAASQDWDMWIDTGDAFRNYNRCAVGDRRIRSEEAALQHREVILNKTLDRIQEKLKGRPFISVAGNHDAISIGECLQVHGCPNIHVIEPGRRTIVGNITFTGFPHCPNLFYWYNFANEDVLYNLVDTTLAASPDVLLTHCPAVGPLCEREAWGVPGLAEALTKSDVKAHFCGHHHQTPGVHYYGNTMSVNGAQKALIHTVEI